MPGKAEGGKRHTSTPHQTGLPPETGSPILHCDNSGPSPSPTAARAIIICWSNMAICSWISACGCAFHLLMQAVQAAKLPGLIDLTPGIRSLQIHYDGASLPRQRLIGQLRRSRPACRICGM